MDDTDLNFSNPEVFIGDEHRSSCSMDSFLDEILKDNTHHHACTHTHTCKPPGPDLSHTHTCFHVHTKILSASGDETAESTEKDSAKKRPSGNREAVRKYREKKKARTASLEDEIVQLQNLNQQLMKRLQGQAALEAEAARLRCLLVDIRGRIEGEIGSFPYQKPMKGGLGSNMMMGGAHVVNSCNVCCDDQLYCLHPGMQGKGRGENVTSNGQEYGPCDIGNIQCMGSSPLGSFGCGTGDVGAAGHASDAEKMEDSFSPEFARLSMLACRRMLKQGQQLISTIWDATW